MTELDLNASITEWELDEWSSEVRRELTAMLVEAGIVHQWDDTILLAESTREADVEEILDEIENFEDESAEQDDDADDADDADQADAKVLSELLTVVQKIVRDPTDSGAITSLEQLLESIDEASAPGDMSDSVWRQIKDLASQVEDALIGGDRADEVLAMDLASRLTAILRTNL